MGLLSKGELMRVLKDGYNATVSNKVVDTEIFYEAVEKFIYNKLTKDLFVC